MPRQIARKVVPKIRPPKAVNRPTSARSYVSSDFLRHLYVTTLLSFSKEQVRRFWAQVPLKDGVRLLPEEELYARLWKDEEKFELSYQLRVFEQLELFLEEEGVNVQKFQDFMSRRVGGSRFLPAKAWLYELNPHMHRFFEDTDARQLLLHIWHELPQNFGADADHRLVAEGEDGDERTGIVTFRLRNRPVDTLNYRAWVLPWLVNAPNIVGLPSYEKVKILADLRHPEAILPRGSVMRRGNDLYQDDKIVGVFASFADYCKTLNLSAEDLGVEDGAECLKVIADITGENNRILFSAGAVCSAPVALAELRYKSNIEKSQNPFAVIIDMLEWPEDTKQEKILNLHQGLVSEVQRKLEVVYFRKEDSIAVNGRHIIKNVPAKIFKKIVTSYVKSGQTYFEYREFKRDVDICMDPNNPNFEVRLQRLMDKINEDFPDLTLKKERRGHFSFHPSYLVTFKEV